tara:strand:- start:188 stop:304 length:117 start_codon:yes stop_codon:yes gene_type:complete
MHQPNRDDLIDLAMVCLVVALMVVWILGVARAAGAQLP